jgi:hypothetical protein
MKAAQKDRRATGKSNSEDETIRPNGAGARWPGGRRGRKLAAAFSSVVISLLLYHLDPKYSSSSHDAKINPKK